MQAGALLYGATVGEVLRLMRGLHLHPLPLAEVIERAQLGSFLRTRTQKLSGARPNGCGTRWRSCRTRTC